jgi:outer membrane protein assembly factor BamB
MSNDVNTDGPGQSFAPAQKPRYFPPLWTWIVVGLCLAAVAWVRRPETSDSGLANVVTAVMGFVALMTLVTWFTFFSRHRLLVRLIPGAVLLAIVATAASMLEISEVTGGMIPVFSMRGESRRPELPQLPNVTDSSSAIDLLTTTTEDFPQFLGPGGRGIVDHVRLDHDWSENLPQVVWRQTIGAGWSGFAVVNGFAVTLEQRGPLEMVTCYDAKSGELKWSSPIEARHETFLGGVGPRSTPTIDEGRVYVLGATGVLRCLDGASGDEIWGHDLLAMIGITPEQDVRSVAWGRAASPLVVDGLVIVPLGGSRDGAKVSLIAFDKVTGEKIWEGGNEQVSYASPSVATILDVPQLLIVNESSVSGHAVESGDVLWRHPWKGASNASASASQAVSVDDARVLISKGYGIGAELIQLARDEDGRWSTSQIWQKNVLKTKLTNVVIHDGYAYGLDDGILSCVELDSGRRRWKRGRYGHGQVLLVGQSLLVVTESGEVVMVEPTPDGHRELGRFQAVEGKTWNNPAMYGPFFLVRNAEEAACFLLPVSAD